MRESLSAPDKRPLVPWKKYQSGKPSREEVQRWQSELRSPAWAVVTGAVSGLIVLDFDGAKGQQTRDRLGLDPHVGTGSGGSHVYFRYPGWSVRTLNGKSKQVLGKECPGLDIRGDGGYAVFAGINERGEYRWHRPMTPDSLDVLPEKLRAMLGLLHPPDLRTNGGPPNPPRADRVPVARLIRRALEQAGSGRNEAGFSLALQLRDNGYSQSEAEAIVGEYASRVPPTNAKGETEPYTRRDALASVQQAYRQPPREPWPEQKASQILAAEDGALPPDRDGKFQRPTVAELTRHPALLDGGGQAADQAEIARLASLRPIEYDRQREAAAERLGVRVTTLDGEVRRIRGDSIEDARGGTTFDLADPEPWPASVDGAALLDELVDTVSTYVALPKFAGEAVALWIFHSHAHDTSFISPILAITSPVLGCGKTTLLNLLSKLSPRALAASSITTASLFRAIEKWRPTLLIDEAETYLRHNEELRGVLDSGHNRAAAWILRCVGEDHEPRKFSTWCGKAIALIGKLPATLASRSVHIEMRRLKPDETVEQLRPDRLAHLEPLRRMAWRWALDHYESLARL